MDRRSKAYPFPPKISNSVSDARELLGLRSTSRYGCKYYFEVLLCNDSMLMVLEKILVPPCSDRCYTGWTEITSFRRSITKTYKKIQHYLWSEILSQYSQQISDCSTMPKATMPFKFFIAVLPALAALACIGLPTNQNGLKLIKVFKSFQPNEYDDGLGNPTIGYGHLCVDTSCSDVSFPQLLTEDTAQQLLSEDLLVSGLQLSDCETISGLLKRFDKCTHPACHFER